MFLRVFSSYNNSVILWFYDLRHIKRHKGLIKLTIKNSNKNQTIKITSSCAWCPSWGNRIPIVASFGLLCGKVPGPTDIPPTTPAGICNSIALVAMDNFLEMLWLGPSHSRGVLGPLSAGWVQPSWDTYQNYWLSLPWGSLAFGWEWPGLLLGRHHSKSRWKRV